MIIVWLAGIVFVCDWFIKRRIQKNYDYKEHKLLFKGRICLCKLYNPGAAMGFLKNHRRILDTVSISSILYILYLIPELMKRGNRIEQVGIGVVLGGALNNCYERLFKGSVTDYINFPKLKGRLKHIVFNLSDFAILIGGIMLIAGEQLRKRN